MGFDTHDYTAGKADWIAEGWETERAADSPRQARDELDRDVQTCAPTDTVAEVTAMVESSGLVVVVNTDRIVLGAIRSRHLQDAPEGSTAEEVMQPGPATVRPFEVLAPLLERMAKAHVTEMIVSTSEGRLLGVVRLPAS